MSNKPKPKAALPVPRELDFEAIGTVWHIALQTPLSKPAFEQLHRKIEQRIATFDRDYSRFRNDSMVAMMAQKAGTYQLPEDAQPLLDLYQSLYAISGGAISPLIGQALSDAGYDASYSLQPATIPETPRWEAILNYEYPNLTLEQPALLDFGAAGKGYLVDIVAAIIAKAGVSDFYINAGGDIVQMTSTNTVLRVGLEHPGDATQAVGVAEVRNQSICGSAGNRRVWSGYTHILDPRTKQSPQHIRAIWVVAESALVADGLATALYFVPPTKLSKHFNYQYAMIMNDYSLACSPDFPAEFFTTIKSQ